MPVWHEASAAGVMAQRLLKAPFLCMPLAVDEAGERVFPNSPFQAEHPVRLAIGGNKI